MTSLLRLRHQCRIAAGLRTFTYSTPLCLYKAQMECAARYIFTGWSAQRDKHGAFKLKPSEARFQLVHNISQYGHIDSKPYSRTLGTTGMQLPSAKCLIFTLFTWPETKDEEDYYYYNCYHFMALRLPGWDGPDGTRRNIHPLTPILIMKTVEKSTFSSGKDSLLHLASLQFLLSTCQCKRVIVVTVVWLIIIIVSTQFNSGQFIHSVAISSTCLVHRRFTQQGQPLPVIQLNSILAFITCTGLNMRHRYKVGRWREDKQVCFKKPFKGSKERAVSNRGFYFILKVLHHVQSCHSKRVIC